MPSAFVFYHYLYPDDVVSAVHLTELCEGMVERGWDVSAYPCNRGCRDENRVYSDHEEYGSVRYHRMHRPNWPQASARGRILNALWMIASWSLLALRTKKPPDVVIIGTDPVLSVLVAIPWKWRFPQTVVAHWCFDLYPEAAIAEGFLRQNALGTRLLRAVLRKAYGCCDLIADIGSCMRDRLKAYRPYARFAELTPWALEESTDVLPTDPQERTALYGDTALALMYSGTFGRAHSYKPILSLARQLHRDNTVLTFSVRGNRVQELEQAISREDTNIRFAPFAPQDRLRARLSAADIHIVSLQPEWNGMVVPSKFFGAIAAGRPVIFAGPTDSAIAGWIERFQLGWVLDETNVEQVAHQLRELTRNPEQLRTLFSRCYNTYQKHFSRQAVIDAWDDTLRSIDRSAA